jgi:hypothetical protein
MSQRKPEPADELPRVETPLKTPWLRDPGSWIDPARIAALIDRIFCGAPRPAKPAETEPA